MAKVATKIKNDFCPQALFLYGTKQEDGQPHFGLFCWFGYCHTAEGFGVMACIGEEKKTKDLIRKNGVFSANLVSEALLPLADYYGCTAGQTAPDKMTVLPTVEWGEVLDVPTIAESPVTYELEVEADHSHGRRIGYFPLPHPPCHEGRDAARHDCSLYHTPDAGSASSCARRRNLRRY